MTETLAGPSRGLTYGQAYRPSHDFGYRPFVNGLLFILISICLEVRQQLGELPISDSRLCNRERRLRRERK